MPLRAVLHQADFLNHGCNDYHTHHRFFGGSYDDGDNDSCYDPFGFVNSQTQNCSYANHSYWPEIKENNDLLPNLNYIPKKERQKGCSRRRRETNEEVIHQQRLTHIAVERNRRKQVNAYLSTLRSLMPHSYAHKSDQASIVGGAINFVKELEQKLEWLETHKHAKNYTSSNNSWPMLDINNAADVEVSMAECFANLKIRAITGPMKNQLLLRILEHLDQCKFTVLHLNVCSVKQVVIYSINLKVEDECNLTSGDEIATVVHQLLSTSSIQY